MSSLFLPLLLRKGFKAHKTHDHCLEELERKKEALLDEDPNANLDGLPVCDIQEELQKVCTVLLPGPKL